MVRLQFLYARFWTVCLTTELQFGHVKSDRWVKESRQKEKRAEKALSCVCKISTSKSAISRELQRRSAISFFAFAAFYPSQHHHGLVFEVWGQRPCDYLSVKQCKNELKINLNMKNEIFSSWLHKSLSDHHHERLHDQLIHTSTATHGLICASHTRSTFKRSPIKLCAVKKEEGNGMNGKMHREESKYSLKAECACFTFYTFFFILSRARHTRAATNCFNIISLLSFAAYLVFPLLRPRKSATLSSDMSRSIHLVRCACAYTQHRNFIHVRSHCCCYMVETSHGIMKWPTIISFGGLKMLSLNDSLSPNLSHRVHFFLFSFAAVALQVKEMLVHFFLHRIIRKEKSLQEEKQQKTSSINFECVIHRKNNQPWAWNPLWP